MPNIPIHLRDLARDRESIAALAAHLIADFHGGEDLAQESVHRLLKAGGPRVHGNRLAWLRTTVRRLAANEYRRRGNRRHREEEAARPEATLSSDQIAERAELCQRVHRAIDSLPRELANVLRDQYFAELAASEIADRDDISINTVKSRARRARTALREVLERDGIGGDVHWSIALAPLVPLGASAPPGAGLPSTLHGTAGAALIMSKVVSVALLLVALYVGVKFILPEAEREVAPAGANTTLASTITPALDDDEQLLGMPPEASERASIRQETASSEAAPPLAANPTAQCFLIADADEFSDCLREAFESMISVAEVANSIGDVVCAQRVPRPFRLRSIVLAIEHVSPDNFIELSRHLADHCSSNRGKHTVVSAVESIAATNEPLYFALRDQLDIDALYGADGHEVMISVAGALARSQGDVELSSIIMEGALGRLGGSAAVVTESIVQALASAQSEGELIQLCRDVLSSPTRPQAEGADTGIGNHLVAHLLMNRALMSSPASEVMGVLLDLCDDPHWGRGAASQIMAYRTREDPPNGIDVHTWRQIWDHASLRRQLNQGD